MTIVERGKELFYKVINKYKLAEFEKLIKHSFWSVFGSALSRGIMLVSSIILARMLSQSEYGELGIVRSTMNMFTIFAGFGIGNTMSRYIALYKKENIKEARRIFDISMFLMLIFALVLSILVYVYARKIAIWSFNDATLYNDLRISSFLLFFSTINGAYLGTLAGFQDFKSIAKNTFYSSCFKSGLTIMGGYFYGVPGALIGFGIGYVVLLLFHKRSVRINFGENKRELSFWGILVAKKRFFWIFSLPAALSSFLVTPVFWWAKSFMIRATDFKEMAIFDVADQWRMIVLFIPSALIPIVLPALTSDMKNFKNTLNFNLKVNFFITLAILVPLVLLSKFVLNLYGEQYNDSYTFILLISSALFTSISSVVGSAIASIGVMWIGLFFNFLWAIYMIFFTVLFINRGMGATGLVYAVFLSYLIHFVIQYIFLKVKFKKFMI